MEWNDFINPRSMLTPGIAGSVVMLITNTLWVEFSLPQKWTALTLSFTLILPILVKFAASAIENIIYFLFNGLIVFALAVNTNFAGRTIQNLSDTGNFISTQRLISTTFNSPSHSTITLTGHEIQLATNQSATSRDQAKKDNAESKKDEKKDQKDKTDQQNKQFFGKWF